MDYRATLTTCASEPETKTPLVCLQNPSVKNRLYTIARDGFEPVSPRGIIRHALNIRYLLPRGEASAAERSDIIVSSGSSPARKPLNPEGGGHRDRTKCGTFCGPLSLPREQGGNGVNPLWGSGNHSDPTRNEPLRAPMHSTTHCRPDHRYVDPAVDPMRSFLWCDSGFVPFS